MMTNLIKRRALLLSGISLLSFAFTITKPANAQSHSPGAGKGKGSDKIHGNPGGGHDDGDDHDDGGGHDDGDDHDDGGDHGGGGKGPKYRGGRVGSSDGSHGHSLVDQVLRKPLPK